MDKHGFEEWYKTYAGDFVETYGSFEYLRRDEVRCGDRFWTSYQSGVVLVCQVSTGGLTTELRYYLHGEGRIARLERGDRDDRVPVLSHSDVLVPIPTIGGS